MYEPDIDRQQRAKAWFVLREARAAGVQLRREPIRAVFEVLYPGSMSENMRAQFNSAIADNWVAIMELLSEQ